MLDIDTATLHDFGQRRSEYIALMKIILPMTILALPLGFLLAACSAPQGKTYAARNRQPPIASGPAQDHAEIFETQQEQTVLLNPSGKLTVWLSSKPSTGYSWRLSEIPDPTVLKLVEKTYVPPTKAAIGQEKWVFEATGEGTVDLRLWYTSHRQERFGSAPVVSCVVSVENPPVAEGPARKRQPAKTKPQAKPKVKGTTPNPEAHPFLDPFFRSSRVLLRSEDDLGPQKG